MKDSNKVSPSIIPCSSLGDYMFVRDLRNQTRHFMTNDQRPISRLQQFRFMLNPPPGIHLFIALAERKRAGYLLLRERNATSCYITEAVVDRWRGKGMATHMIEFAKTRKPVLIADILDTNRASIGLHEACGFQFVGSQNGILTYRYANRDTKDTT
jgi:L-amino acid N-acyltransferase YncA